MIKNKSVKKVLFGGDYNPEQWDDAVRQEDMRMLTLAGIDIVTLNVFSWARLQPSEDTYDFADLDSIINQVTAAGMNICLATATAAHPAWMARKYPDILRVDIDGRKRAFGARQNSCPNSPAYRKYSVLLAKKLAERYGTRKNILAWHISNEYGGLCYCDNCRDAFRTWLKNKYKTIDALNEAWNTAFWGHTYYDWDDIVVPSHLSERWPVNRTSCQIQTIDYYRFQSDSLLDCFCLEADAIKKITPHIPVTTNFMGTYMELDYHKWAPHLDFISWDNYPSPDEPYTRAAMNHEVMRGCKPDKPFALMEQTPSVTNWQPYNALKRPGVMRLQSYQAAAHGADTIMFFQMHRSRGCCEKFHGAVIDHYARTDTRVFKETAALGAELKKLGNSFTGSTIRAHAAIIFDWNCMWGITFSAGPSVDFNYTSEVFKYYDALSRENIPVDIIGTGQPLNKYDILFAPALYMFNDQTAVRITDFVKKGGSFITTCMSGMADENDLVTTTGYPGKLRELCGLWVEETDALLPEKSNTFEIADGPLHGSYPAVILCDCIRPERAETIAVYGSDFYKGTPALCRNAFGKGEAWYIGSCVPAQDNMLLRKLVHHLVEQHGIIPVLPPQYNIEATERIQENGTEFVFILNHDEKAQDVVIPFSGKELLSGTDIASRTILTIQGRDTAIIRKQSIPPLHE
jgi:beta-galactosidase